MRSLSDIRPLYFLPRDPLAEEVLIPGFQTAEKVDCMVGFFSSQVLVSLAPGLATYIAGSRSSFRLIISPLLRPEDQAAIEDGIKPLETIAREILDELTITEDLLEEHTLKCLSWLLRTGRIEIRIALMKGALFHPKVWLFTDGAEVMAVHGSSNVTHAGIKLNIEQVAISKSWENSNRDYITEKLCDQFRWLWENKEDNCIVVAMPQAIRDRLLKTYRSEVPPTEADLRALYLRAAGVVLETPEGYEMPQVQRSSFLIPSGLRFEDGPFEHPGREVITYRGST